MSKEFTKEDIELLSRYVTNSTGRIFCVQGLPGIIGAVYTRYSRAKGGFREIFLNEFIKEGLLNHKKADNLIERVLIQFGDESVQELEGSYLSLEQVSNLITKLTEDRRIGGSPLEQSSRYVYYYEKDDEGEFKYYRDPKIMNSRYANEFIETMDLAFQTYSDCIEPMREFLKKLKPMEEAEYEIRKGREKQRLKELKDEKEIKDFKRTYNFDLKTKACDIVRVLLPAATLTNVGFFGNGRFFEKMLTKLYSNELSEAQEVAKEAHTELNKLMPKYIKRAKRDPYLVDINNNMMDLASRVFNDLAPESEENVVLLDNNSNQFLNTTVAQMLYPYSQHPLRQIIKLVNTFSDEFKQEVIDTYMGERKIRFNRPGRALEYGYPLTFDLIGNFGIYRDLHRHRMLT